MKLLSMFVLGLALISSARADVSDSGNLSIGGNGVIVGSMTVQGSGFSVGGSSFALAGGSATIAYQLQAGSLNSQSIRSGTQCLRADSSGNITGTGADCAAASTNLASSTTANAIAPVGPLTNGSFTSCNVVGSTLTITNAASNERIRYTFQGDIKTDSSGFSPMCTDEINGAFPSGYGVSTPIFSAYLNPGDLGSNVVWYPFWFDFTSERLSATTISVCLSCAMTGGGGQNWYLGHIPLRAGLYEVR